MNTTNKMIFKFSKNARLDILDEYREYKKKFPNLKIANSVKALLAKIQKEGLYVVSDVQLAIWVAKGYDVYRTKDSKWYFGGYHNKKRTIFTAKESLPAGKMADSAHDSSAIEHNNYHPKNKFHESNLRIKQIIREVVRSVIREEIQKRNNSQLR